jgi:hypothetical protein
MDAAAIITVYTVYRFAHVALERPYRRGSFLGRAGAIA